MTKQSKFSYLAGIMDGEGSFSISRTRSTIRTLADGSKRKYITCRLSVEITNTHEGLMQWIKDNFGGRVNMWDGKDRNPKYKLRYTWSVCSQHDIETFVLGILPYLIVKRKQALVALEYCKTFQRNRIGTSLSSETQDKRNDLRQQMLSLNNIHPECLDVYSKPVETTRETPLIEDDDIVRTVQQCTEVGRNIQPGSEMIQ